MEGRRSSWIPCAGRDPVGPKRSNSLPICDYMPEEYARLIKHESLSYAQSPTCSVGEDSAERKNRLLHLLAKIFCGLKKTAVNSYSGGGSGSGAGAIREEEKRNREKKRSSWLPDPERRWPIQGW